MNSSIIKKDAKVHTQLKRMGSSNRTKEEQNVSTAVRGIDFVNYHEGGVVSRTIIDKPFGTVTVFAFDAGQGLREHTTPFDALVYLLEGEAEIVISGNSLRLEAGEMVVMPAEQPHALKALKRFKMILVLIGS